MQQRDTNAFYSWRAYNRRGRGQCGITGHPERAVTLLFAALKELAPDAVGSLDVVRLDRHVWPPSYRYAPNLMLFRRGTFSGD
ncbi:hypothetical protein [Nonomuraea sp. NPDC050643]|uniref:hypothetical protein n=1 Tax=Nonomuraea sp. NPDC050643 TaxID=3155660 RepID=UPI0033D3DA19